MNVRARLERRQIDHAFRCRRILEWMRRPIRLILVRTRSNDRGTTENILLGGSPRLPGPARAPRKKGHEDPVERSSDSWSVWIHSRPVLKKA